MREKGFEVSYTHTTLLNMLVVVVVLVTLLPERKFKNKKTIF
jgi:hypothetical protein